MLAAGPDALLGGDGPDVVPLLRAEEDPLELDHPRVREQKSGVLFRHKRGARENPVLPLTEVIQKPLADLRCCHPRIGH